MLRAEEKSGQNPPGSGEAGRQVISRLPARGAGRVAVGGHDQSRQVSTSQVGAEWVGRWLPKKGSTRTETTPEKRDSRAKGRRQTSILDENHVKKQFMGNNTNSRPNFNSHFYHSRTRKSFTTGRRYWDWWLRSWYLFYFLDFWLFAFM